MKKLSLILILVLVCAVAASCVKPDVTEPTPSTTPAQSSDTQAVALLYMDPSIDMFLTVNAPDWVYTKELYEGEAYFYPKAENPANSPNGFAISSEKLPDKTIDEVWAVEEGILQSNLQDFKWDKEDNIDVGGLTGYRYHFTGSGITGDYLYWETDKLLYTCSFTSSEDKYETNFAMLRDSLKTFQVLSEMK